MKKKGYVQIADKYDRIFIAQKWWNKLVWGFHDTAYTGELLLLLSDDFSGKLLDIPVGTGLFTKEKYSRMSNADITCMDYSEAMMENARRKFSGDAFRHVTCMQRDVRNLPFVDNTFDMALSMNGFHAFPDKKAAFRETERMLKSDGIFVGCCYVKGERKRTDWLSNVSIRRWGGLCRRFRAGKICFLHCKSIMNPLICGMWVGSIACFRGIKK